MMKLNPYIAGNPVGGGEAFIGRADVLREVVRVLRNPHQNAIVLYGQRRIGKTSILQHLAAWLPKTGVYYPIYFDLQDKATWPLKRVLEELAQTIAQSLGQSNPDLRLGSSPEVAFRDTWLPTILNSLPVVSSLVLLFDEFDVLTDPKSEQAATAFFPYLRDLIASDPQRLKFIFVIGRTPDDLINIALSLFKSIPIWRVSLLNREETITLIRLAETNHSLCWPDDVVERVWQLTNGHPFLTQLLCYMVWEQAYENEPEEPPTITLAEVEMAVSSALDVGRNALEWLWNGLPPAGRIVVSALAEAGPAPITQEVLEERLRDSGVRIIIRELQDAPRLLQEWDFIEPVDGEYRFRVELLRRWIAERKPLSRVKDELDSIEPVAENFYQAALGLYRSGNLEQAVEPLRKALSINPNHLRANELLTDILLAQNQLVEARQLLESLFEYHPASARPRLVQVLLRQAQSTDDEEEQMTLFEQVLQLDANQSEATIGLQRILKRRGDNSQKTGDLELEITKTEDTHRSTEGASGLGLAQEIGFTAQTDKLSISKPWVPPYIKPSHYEEILRSLSNGVSCLVVGLPRSGKTELLNQIHDKLERDGKHCVFIDPTIPSDRDRLKEGQIYDSDMHQADVILIDEIERILSREGLLLPLRKLQSEKSITIISTAYQSREELLFGLNKVDSPIFREMFSSEYFLHPWKLEQVEDLYRTLNMSSRSDVTQFLFDVTGGIPALVISAIEVWLSLQFKNGENKDKNPSTSTDIKEELFKILTQDKSIFDGFWRALPCQHQRALLLSTISHEIKETGTLISERQLQKILRKHFSKDFASASKTGLLSEDKLISSTLLKNWTQHLAFSQYDDAVLSIVQNMLPTDLAYANVMAEYLELFGAKRSATLQDKRQQYAVASLNTITQRVVGLILILLSFWGILELLGIL